MNNQPDLSIVILNYKMDGLLKNCLKSIGEHPTEKNVEVVVVDNDSGDLSEEIVANHFPDVKYIQAGDNLGHAKGNNIGIKNTTGRYVMILNPDVVFMEPIFDRIVDYMDANRNIGMTTVKLRNPDGSIQAGSWRFHDLLTPLYQRSSLLRKTKRGQRAIKDFNMHEWDRKESRDVDWVQGSCLVARRDVIDQIGLMDERFFLYFTDVDWCRRCWGAGWKVHYFADASLVHYYHRESADKLGLKSLANKTTRIHITDWIRYLRKYRGQPKPKQL